MQPGDERAAHTVRCRQRDPAIHIAQSPLLLANVHLDQSEIERGNREVGFARKRAAIIVSRASEIAVNEGRISIEDDARDRISIHPHGCWQSQILREADAAEGGAERNA
jgi:hypothetical protein